MFGSTMTLQERLLPWRREAARACIFTARTCRATLPASTTTGTLLVSYVYDAWGKVTATNVAGTTESATVLARNPYLYHGYRYDSETGLYYLNSRYYDPETGRFINADGFVSTGQGQLSANMFAYCENNPVNREDKNGQWGNIIIGALIGAVVGVIGQVVSDVVTSIANGEVTISNWQTYTGALVGGAVGGAILGGTGNVALANAAARAVTTGVGTPKQYREIHTA